MPDNQPDQPHRPPHPEDRDAEGPSVGETAAEAAGGASGAVLGAAVGSFGGPIGALLGGIAGALGGWWAGREVAHDVALFSEEDERHYRTHWDSRVERPPELTYDRARIGYTIGHIAGRNPEYQGRRFEEIEPELRRGWAAEHGGEWEAMRDYVRQGYERSRSVGEANRV